MSWMTEPEEKWESTDAEPKSRLRLVALFLGGWLVVSLLVLVGLLLFGGHSPSGNKSSKTPSATASGGTSSSAGTADENLPDGWVREAADDQTNCSAHSYGQVQTFFATTPCSSVHRTLATTNQGGRMVVIASNVVTFDTPAQAKKYLTLVNSDGTGNINDLLREGVTFAGAPARLPTAAFASRQEGVRVWVAEAGYVSGTSNENDPALKALAAQAVAAS